jgi:hypothetical protein
MRLEKTSACVLALLLFGFAAGAQNRAMDWSVIPGGGGVSSNDRYSLAGTIGQPAAGLAMSGGNYSLTGGFWSLISVVQTAGAPTLSISHTAGQIIVSWPTPATGWTLLQSSSLAAGGPWVTSGWPVAATNGTSSITISAPAGNLFFRLSQP